MSVRSSLGFAAVMALAGCASAAPSSGFAAETTKPSAPSSSSGSIVSSTNATTPAAAASTSQVSQVFGHSDTTLYKLDPDTKAVTVIADFSGCGGSVLDIALDESSNLFATTEDGLYSISLTTAVCTQIATGTYPNSLSFVPQGTVDANAEALVGYNGSDYVRIDPKTGEQTTIGNIGSGDLQSSGDVVAVKGGSTYLTVTGTGCDTDCLLEVDPKSGAMVKNWGPTGFTNVYGLAFWAGKVYGFDEGGDLFEVDLTNSLVATAITIPQSVAALSFWGAGSTTSAPTTADPK